MKFAVIGSCIGGDIIAKAKNLGWANVANFVSFSPIALLENSTSVELDDECLKDCTPNDKIKLKNDFAANVLKQIKAKNPDFILIDIGDFRIPVQKIKVELESKKAIELVVTKKNISDTTRELINKCIEKKLKGKIIEISEISIHSASDEKIEEFLMKYIDKLEAEFGKERLIFFKPRLVNQYISKEGNIEFTSNFKISASTNVLMDKLYGILKKHRPFIDAPQNIIGDENCMTPFEYHSCQPYYDYMQKCISNIVEGNAFDEMASSNNLKQCELKIHELYNKIFCNQILDKIKTKTDKDIVLIAKTRQFESMLKERLQKELYSYIEYNENSDMNQIENQIRELKAKNDNLIFAVPEFFRHYPQKGLHTCFYNNNYLFCIDYFAPNYKKVLLNKFIGVYSDVYNNYLNTKSCLKSINIIGAANEIMIGEGSTLPDIVVQYGCYTNIESKIRFLQGIIRNSYEGTLTIGKNSSFGNCDLCCHSFSKINIGQDVMVSIQVMIYSGDGHSIFQLKEDGKYKLINPCTKDQIVIGNHVWIGYRCNILGGSNIGEGSIVGAGSLVNKKFPNNVILVGSPAKIIKKDIAWSRNVLITQIEQDANMFENFANNTKNDEQ